VTLELKDGDHGDLDHIVNGEIVDPGGAGVAATFGGGGGGGCFIDTTASTPLSEGSNIITSINIMGIIFLSCFIGWSRFRRN
jgi:hypothetical protein